MEIHIESLIFLILLLVLFVWFIWNRLSRKILERRYNQENDKSYKAEENRKKLLAEEKPNLARRIGPASKSIRSISRFKESRERNSLSTTNVGSSGKDSDSVRKKFGRRGIFRKFRRRT